MTTENNNTPAESHEVQMLRKAVAADPTQIPEQFNGDAEKFINSYKSLQAEFTRKSQELAALKNAAPPSQEPKTEEVKPVDLEIKEPPKVEPPKVTWNSAVDEFSVNGDVSEETRKALSVQLAVDKNNLEEIAGVRQMIDTYVEAMKGQRNLAQTRAVEIAGGVEQYNAVVEWGQKNLNAAEKAQVNQALKSAAWELTWTGLVARFNKAVGDSGNKNPNTPNANMNSAVKPFETQAEMTQAMRDPRYRTHLAYRQEVEARVIATQNASR